MKKIALFTIFAMLFTTLTVTVTTSSACASDSHAKDVKSEGFNLIHVADLEQWLKTESDNVHVFDANNESTRTKEGVIPTAQALPSSSHYDVATLPADKNSKVVFYCANTSCMASHDAAKVAVKAGYKNVFVMADGIQGWKKAGKPTQKFDKKG